MPSNLAHRKKHLVSGRSFQSKDREEAMLFKLIKRSLVKSPAFLTQCEIRPVKSREELFACSTLVHKEYVEKKYIIPHGDQLRMTVHQATHKSTTFVVLYKRKYILATLTLVEDSPLGVPMEKIYKSRLDHLRNNGGQFAEVSMLAENFDLMKKIDKRIRATDQLAMLLHLFKAMFSYARYELKLNALVACFHPRHAPFYRALRFNSLDSRLSRYEDVQGAPALAYWLNMDRLDKEASGTMRLFYGLDVSKEYLNRQKIRPALTIEDLYTIFRNANSANE